MLRLAASPLIVSVSVYTLSINALNVDTSARFSLRPW